MGMKSGCQTGEKEVKLLKNIHSQFHVKALLMELTSAQVLPVI